MRLHIFIDDRAGYIEKQWWSNFRLSLDPEAWPGAVLKENYDATLMIQHEESGPYIEFDDDESATMFILKWA